MTKLLIFDYDNTIAPSKSSPSQEMLTILYQLLQNNHIAILTGGRTQKNLQDWFIKKMPQLEAPFTILLCTEYGNIIHQGNFHWKKIYNASKFNVLYRNKILQLWEDLDHAKYGLESDRENQIVCKETILSIKCLGKDTKLRERNSWDPNMKKRIEIVQYFGQNLPPDINIYVTGKNTIDFVEIGKDKGNNILKLSKLLNISLDNIEFFGDEFREYGNDYSALGIGITTHIVKDPTATLSLLKKYS
ncbi:HAD-IIB family hydrolase [bacterium]|nr:HAD-IIB family hydrolase [bacterium]